MAKQSKLGYFLQHHEIGVVTEDPHKMYYIGVFKPDKRNSTGFDMDLFHIDTVYFGDTGQVTYALRSFKIQVAWVSRLLQRWFGV